MTTIKQQLDECLTALQQGQLIETQLRQVIAMLDQARSIIPETRDQDKVAVGYQAELAVKRRLIPGGAG